MSLLVPNTGEAALLNLILGKATAGNLVLHLYTNDVTPGETNTVASFTESTAAGYASKTLTASSWTVATADGVTTATYAAQLFQYTAAETVYGYYVTDAAGTTLLWAERFTETFTAGSSGGGLYLTPTFSLD